MLATAAAATASSKTTPRWPPVPLVQTIHILLPLLPLSTSTVAATTLLLPYYNYQRHYFYACCFSFTNYNHFNPPFFIQVDFFLRIMPIKHYFFQLNGLNSQLNIFLAHYRGGGTSKMLWSEGVFLRHKCYKYFKDDTYDVGDCQSLYIGFCVTNRV